MDQNNGKGVRYVDLLGLTDGSYTMISSSYPLLGLVFPAFTLVSSNAATAADVLLGSSRQVSKEGQRDGFGSVYSTLV